MTDWKMPSGKDYGIPLRCGWVDDRDFILAVYATKVGYRWIVEYKDGSLVLEENHTPFHPPVFGIDEQDWMGWVQTTYDRIDDWLASKCSFQGEKS